MTPNGHPVTKAELQEVLEAALTAQYQRFQTSLAELRNEFKTAATGQDGKFHTSLNEPRHESRAALTVRDDKFSVALTAQTAELKQRMRQFETNLVTAFRSYATGQLHPLEITDHDLVLRLGSIEDRLLALESRRPPSV